MRFINFKIVVGKVNIEGKVKGGFKNKTCCVLTMLNIDLLKEMRKSINKEIKIKETAKNLAKEKK